MAEEARVKEEKKAVRAAIKVTEDWLTWLKGPWEGQKKGTEKTRKIANAQGTISSQTITALRSNQTRIVHCCISKERIGEISKAEEGSKEGIGEAEWFEQVNPASSAQEITQEEPLILTLYQAIAPHHHHLTNSSAPIPQVIKREHPHPCPPTHQAHNTPHLTAHPITTPHKILPLRLPNQQARPIPAHPQVPRPVCQRQRHCPSSVG